jgi:hypothetical protein
MQLQSTTKFAASTRPLRCIYRIMTPVKLPACTKRHFAAVAVLNPSLFKFVCQGSSARLCGSLLLLLSNRAEKHASPRCKRRWKCAQFLSVVLRTCSHVRSFRQHRRTAAHSGAASVSFQKSDAFRCCSLGSSKRGRIWGMTRFINSVRTIRDAWSPFWSVCWMRKDHWLEPASGYAYLT